MMFTFLAAAAVLPVLSLRPSHTASVRHASFARLRDLARSASSEGPTAMTAIVGLVDSIMLEEGNATAHLTAADQALLQEVIAMINDSMYASMTSAQTTDATSLQDAIDAINQCYADFTVRVSEDGDIHSLRLSAVNYQNQLNDLQDAVDEKTLNNATAWSNLETHMQLISPAPDCSDFPNPRTMGTLDVYFADSLYVTWWTQQQAAYYPVRDAYLEAHYQLEEALRAYAVGLGVRDVGYCFWKFELEVACAAFSACYEARVAHYLHVVKPGVETSMKARIEAYKAGQTIIHQIGFLLGDEANQATPAINTAPYQMAFPGVPPKPPCDMSALHDSMWVPTPECSRGCDETVDLGHRQDGYRGCQTHTESGRLCQKWTGEHASWARMEGGESQRFPDKGLGDHNFCRNPDHETNGIWCWATGGGSSWEYCNPLDAHPPTLPPAPPTLMPTPSPTASPTQAPTSNDFPAGLLTCSSGPAALKTSCSGNLDQLNQDVRAAVTAHYKSLPNNCDDAGCPKGDLAGCLVRLAGHDVMDFNPALNNHGSDGCIDFADPDNKGLHGCMLRDFNERDSVNISLELMWQDFCQEVSAADFFVLAAEVMMAATTPAAGGHQDMWTNSFASNFRFGRTTATECSPEPLPNPTHSCDAVQEVFIDRLGLTWTQSAALMGVHTLGRALPENSGYDGFWVSQTHAKSWTPEYYNRIIGVGWTPEETSAGKFQWRRSDGALQGEMMLNTDMCLAYQSGRQEPLTRAEDGNHSNCCLWKDAGDSDMDDVICNCQANDVSQGCTFGNCCASGGGCPGNDPFRRFMNGRSASSVESWDAVIKYAKTATGFVAWHDDFIPTWTKVTTQGQDLC